MRPLQIDDSRRLDAQPVAIGPMVTSTRCAASVALLLGTAAALLPVAQTQDVCSSIGQLDAMDCDAAAQKFAEQQKTPAKAP